MGKGVTKNALISLLHLSHEMTSMNTDKVRFNNCSITDCADFSSFIYYLFVFFFFQDLISQWSLGNEAASEDTVASQLGLAWLIPLWVDRDQEVGTAP